MKGIRKSEEWQEILLMLFQYNGYKKLVKTDIKMLQKFAKKHAIPGSIDLNAHFSMMEAEYHGRNVASDGAQNHLPLYTLNKIKKISPIKKYYVCAGL